jgi:SPX domain protein involved in polyphosphate accumulation
MKFGKRLASEASRRWVNEWIHYKSLKRSIKEDLRNHGQCVISTIFCSSVFTLFRYLADGNASSYRAALLRELARVSTFYCQKEVELAVRRSTLKFPGGPCQQAMLRRTHWLG